MRTVYLLLAALPVYLVAFLVMEDAGLFAGPGTPGPFDSITYFVLLHAALGLLLGTWWAGLLPVAVLLIDVSGWSDQAFENSSATIFTFLLSLAAAGAGLTLGGVAVRKAAIYMIQAWRQTANG